MDTRLFFAAALIAGVAGPASAAVLTYGDTDCLGQSCYGASDPTSGATLQGLAPGASTLATNSFGHGFPFAPGVGDFTGTDQIFVGAVQTGFHDGYSGSAERISGPQSLVLNYGSLVLGGQVVTSLTLGIAADDFQFPAFGQPFVVTINGTADAELTALLNGLDQTGPVVRFLTIGIELARLDPSNILTIGIDQGGDGGDGWAVDFLTVGVTTADATPTPEPASLALLGAGLLALARRRRSASPIKPAPSKARLAGSGAGVASAVVTPTVRKSTAQPSPPSQWSWSRPP